MTQKGVAWERAVRAAGLQLRGGPHVRFGLIDLPESCIAYRVLPHGRSGQPERHRQAVLRLPRPAGWGAPGVTPCRLVWTLKAKTIADPIGNEEQTAQSRPEGALVDLRCGPHEAVWVVDNDGTRRPMRKEGERVSQSGPSAMSETLPERQTTPPSREGCGCPVGTPASGCSERGLGPCESGWAHRRRMSGFARPCAASAPTGVL